jgi:hypothetical protein
MAVTFQAATNGAIVMRRPAGGIGFTGRYGRGGNASRPDGGGRSQVTGRAPGGRVQAAI